jgi:hypothetical protein
LRTQTHLCISAQTPTLIDCLVFKERCFFLTFSSLALQQISYSVVLKQESDYAMLLMGCQFEWPSISCNFANSLIFKGIIKKLFSECFLGSILSKLLMPKFRFSFLYKSLHPLFLIVSCKQGMEVSPLEENAFGQR